MPLSLPFFKFNVTDWLTSEKIAVMEPQHIGAYIMLLAQCWSQGTCTLPTDSVVLKKLSKWQDEKHGDFGLVLACFSPLKKTGRLTNLRLYSEWQEARIRTELLSESGQRGAVKRWAKPLISNGHATPKSGTTWAAYLEAYHARYHVDPVRNKQINSHLSRLVDRLGVEESPHIAAFYLTHNKPLYVTARHPTNLLLRDAEGLRTEWATGIKSTTLEARSAEMVDAAQEQIKRVGKLLEGRRHETT